ncbi:CopD family protein [Cupriavidus sp. CuC1]|uniref:CopD family protein n=1 Tax=Cupriavidus sp. CuC1 TaxID=3373131 RepID=UPI0037D2E486
MGDLAATLSWWLGGGVSVVLAATLGVWLLLPTLPPQLAQHWMRSCLLLLACVFLAYLPASTLALADGPAGELLPTVWLVLWHTHNGAMWLLGAVALIVAAIAISGESARPARSRPRGAMAASLLLFVGARAATGHAAEAGTFSAVVLIHVVHIAAGCAWAGCVMASQAIPRSGPESDVLWQTAFLQRLSQVAALALTLVVVSGLFNVWRILDAAQVSFGTYEQRLTFKLTVVGLAAALGAWNRWIALPRLLQGGASARKPFELSLRAEAVLLVLVLLLAAWLGSTMPSR